MLTRSCLRGASMESAILAPRAHVSHLADGTAVVDHEPDAALEAAIAASGLAPRPHGALDMFFGGVGAAYRRSSGEVEAAGDPRREAAVGVVTV
ncbi:hypothetical protein BN12_2340009 [Nostocoides japonicum T1-X7]|uniref:Uncharacterized protein n=1 Tax=Nostocoides japonicum T1-X7 TaxID=1194083 RepID=A0A077LW06_9MICO|nr:hypothetical protein BN12_2340009 [Tetrasphaera japonica T1-X7]